MSRSGTYHQGNAMRPILILVLLCRLAPSGWGASAPEPKKEPLLAVMDILNNTGEFSAFVDGMPDMLITELMVTGDIELVERTKVQTAMKALKIETSGLTQERNIELGKWLGVDGILFGAFNRVGDKYRLDVRAIDVQTGKINVSASAISDKQNILDIIPEIGNQLRSKLAGSPGDRAPSPPAAAAPVVKAPAVDSCPLEIQYKMLVGLLSESGIPHQRVRIYLDNNLLHVSEVVNGLNRYFVLFKGNIPAGSHTLVLIHGSVDKRGRWIRELESQPDPYSFSVRKGDRPGIQYKMHAHDHRHSFKDFKLNYNNQFYGGN